MYDGTCQHVLLAHKFTGKERDSESGLDDFGVRYFGSSMGRFMSPDPSNAGAESEAPQSWNAYSYVVNNPLNAVDPDGQDCVYVNDNSASVVRGDCKSDTDNGIFINGTIDTTSGTYNSSTGTLGFNYTNDDTGAIGSAVIGNVYPAASPTPDYRDFAAHIAGSQLLINEFVKQVAINVAVGAIGRGIGLGIEAIQAARAANAATEAAEVANLAAKAASTVGNQGAVASSQATALAAAEEFVGAGARPIVDRATGQVVGKISADGSKVYRITSINKAQPYVNLVNKTTGGNLHVRF